MRSISVRTLTLAALAALPLAACAGAPDKPMAWQAPPRTHEYVTPMCVDNADPAACEKFIAFAQTMIASTVSVRTTGWDREMQDIVGHEATGVAVAIDGKTYILTAYHAVDDANITSIYARQRNLSIHGDQIDFGGALPLRLVVALPQFDAAVLEPMFAGTDLPPPLLARTDPIMALGKVWHFGKTSQVEGGRITEFGGSWDRTREISVTTVYRGDLPVIPGDSGGPVVDDAGRLVAIVCAGDYAKIILGEDKSVYSAIGPIMGAARKALQHAKPRRQ